MTIVRVTSLGNLLVKADTDGQTLTVDAPPDTSVALILGLNQPNGQYLSYMISQIQQEESQ